MVEYLDTSAFIKLVRSEPESTALRTALSGVEGVVSSALLLVEGRRAAARFGSTAAARARLAEAAITLLPVDDATLEAAADLEPAALGSLDAIHLATALGVGPDLGRFFCYDARLAGAAAAHGLDVQQPI